jgi:Uma2 family endonuclease
MSVRTLPPPLFSPATIDDLLKVEGKAELIGGRIVRYMATGHQPNIVAGRIFRKLADFVDMTGLGNAYTDSMGFAIPTLPSGRQSFSPDASYYNGPPPLNRMRFVTGPPTFAAEVRSENDYGPAAEVSMAAKRNDYFAAGTLVVWDVDPDAGVVDCYRADFPDKPVRFGAGQTADAEPAVPGWTVDVNWLMA